MRRWLVRIASVAVLIVVVAALFYGATHLSPDRVTTVAEAVGALAALGALYLACTARPAWLFTLAIMLTPFAGNWPQLHVPGPVAPDRVLFVLGIVVVLFRSYVVGDLPRPRFGFAHAMMALAVLYAAVSAMAFHSLFQKGPGLLLVETFGILPFVSFWLGPVVFPTARERRILLGGLVIMAGYLGLTALFETAGPKALVFPRYILSSDVGIQAGRARGPFADAVANGVGLYVGAVASAIAVSQWRTHGWRIVAGVVCVLCLAGTVMTLERSIWIATGAATLVGLLASRVTRRRAIPIVTGIIAVAAIAIVAIPGLEAKVTSRLHNPESLYDRENSTNTALNMIRAKPLLGFGWNQYQADHDAYVQQSPNMPLTGTTIDLSSAYLTYAVELGLVGGTLWLLSVLMGAGGTALRRAPPDVEPWRVGLLALLVFFLVGEAAVPPTVFVNASLWLWAGAIAAIRYRPHPPLLAEPQRVEADRRRGIVLEPIESS